MLAFIGNTLLYYTFLLCRALASLVAKFHIVSTLDCIFALFRYMPIQMVLVVLGDLTVSVKDLTVIEFATKQ